MKPGEDRERAIDIAHAAVGTDNPLRDVLRLLVEQNRQFFFYVHDREGIFTYLSSSVLAITGRTPEQWMRHYTTYLTDNPINVQAGANTELTLSTGAGPPSYLVEVLHADGRPIMLEVFEQPIERSGRIDGICGLAHDVTERTRAQADRDGLRAELEHARRLEALGNLAGAVAHDFNNSLAVISLAAQSLLGLVAGVPGAAARVIEISDTADQASQLTQKLLAIGRKQVGRPTRVQLNPFLTTQHGMIQRLVGGQIDVQLALGERVPVVELDEAQLVQVLLNLATNARDAMPAGGVLRLETAAVDLPRPGALLTVTDAGVGMDEETQARVFEPFFTTKPPGRGSGLGLASVHGAITQSGGTIRVTSQLGVGTRFEIWLPAARVS